MQSIKLVDGDLVFENGELLVIEGAEEIAQCCKIALGTNNNEWFLNPDMGILFKSFLGKNISEDEMREQIRQGLFQERRIKSVDNISFTVDKANRSMVVAFTATSEDGEVVQSEVNVDAG